MIPRKLPGVLQIIADNFTQNQIPYSLIGALALGLYGLPRYTANPDRSPKDDADIFEVLKLYKKKLIPKHFSPLDMDKIFLFADRFGQRMRIQELVEKLFDDSTNKIEL